MIINEQRIKQIVNETIDKHIKMYEDETKIQPVESLGDGSYHGKMSGYVFTYNGRKYKMPFGIRTPFDIDFSIKIENGEVSQL